jgi:hypothetical protein
MHFGKDIIAISMPIRDLVGKWLLFQDNFKIRDKVGGVVRVLRFVTEFKSSVDNSLNNQMVR